ncbi:MAG: diguanylate cyclase [Myxococcota bacterium]
MYDIVALLLRSRTLRLALKNEITNHLGLEVELWEDLEAAAEALKAHPDRYLTAITNPNFGENTNASIDTVFDAQVPCVVLTSSFSEPLRQQLLSQGVADYVVKDQNLVENVARLLHRMQQGRGRTILIVDDSTPARKLARTYLLRLGFQVLEAPDGETALETLDTHDVQLVLTDFEMPGISGADLAANIRAKWGWDEIGVIGLSNSGSYSSLTAEFLKRGANDFLRKPFQPEELSCRVFHNLEMHNTIAKLREERRKAAILATTDVLTGAYNRRAFFSMGEDILKKAAEDGQPAAAVMLDIDHFKRFNDTHGHATGDDVLKATVDACLSVLGEDVLFGRLGGEEFAALFVGISTERVETTCEQMRCAIMNNKVPSPDGDLLQVTSSFGLIHSDGSVALDDLLQHADEALYDAKKEGRNCVVSRTWGACAA